MGRTVRWIGITFFGAGGVWLAVWLSSVPSAPPVDYAAKLECLQTGKDCDTTANQDYLAAFSAKAKSNPGKVSLTEYDRARQSLESEKERLSHETWERDASRLKRIWYRWTGERL